MLHSFFRFQALNLSAQVSSISGGLTLTCPPDANSSYILANTSSSSTDVSSCALTSLSPAFRALFNVTPPPHNASAPYSSTDDIPPILLSSCAFGECIAQNAFDASGFNPAASSSTRASGFTSVTMIVLASSMVGALFSWL